MEWHDEGIVLTTRPLGERDVVVELMTAAHGRHLGLVRGGRSRRLQPVLQPSNTVDCRWRARLDEQLGAFAIEPITGRAGTIMESAVASFGLATLSAHLRHLPERDPHPGLYSAFTIVLDHLDTPAVAGALMVRFEMALLEELGFGLDVSRCAVSGETSDLTHVSPKTGRAVGRVVAEPYLDRLLPLPRFLIDRGMNADPDLDDIRAGLGLTGHFLDRHLNEPRGILMPRAREHFLAALAKALPVESSR
ncbi:DNA repair protein RecO [Segnochrobactrum spirostomi]|uniref:DNA repair protein RecO n=1 Tax=Segnochrobactrum spirostomi TaxID=2608987 RepID=A0A6A7Y045_9HYPH|nr:DNA repair protein RecO [Segnochrobactrum spirostomi]MQT11757.1 DNA repair protein RecO [Segnochrobactrum spirostomi]